MTSLAEQLRHTDPYSDIVEHGGGGAGLAETLRGVSTDAKDAYRSLHPMDQAALATAPIPIVGDVTGLAADVRMFAQEPESRTPLNFGLAGLGVLPFIPSLGMVKAYHGTPHKVDKFKMDKIGTGEGWQAYGHGLYFADNPKVAGSYKHNNLEDAVLTLDGEDALLSKGIPSDVDAEAIKVATRYDWDDFGALNRKSVLNQGDDITPKWYAENKRKLGIQNEGNLYNVNLDVNPEDLLDWDVGISKQSKEVQGKFDDMFENILGDGTVSEPQYDQLLDTLYRQKSGGDIYKTLSEFTGGDEQASLLLKKYDIKGIKYLDGNSRKVGEGTRNYVIFDEDLIDIADDIMAEPKGMLGDVITKQEMINRGADGYLSKAYEMEIPISKLDGLEPVPAADTISGAYEAGREIKKPIEVVYDAANDKYMVYGGNHRIAQAKANGQTNIKAFVEPENGLVQPKGMLDVTDDIMAEYDETVKNIK